MTGKIIDIPALIAIGCLVLSPDTGPVKVFVSPSAGGATRATMLADTKSLTGPDTEVTCELHSISLRSALDLLFRQPGFDEICYFIDKEVLLVTTIEERNQHLTARVYRS